MNSYGSVSLVSQAIYRVLRYMNFFPPRNTSDQMKSAQDTGNTGNTDSRIVIDPAQPLEQSEQPEQLEQLEPGNSESVKEIIVAIS
jgi:hypothetical protein